MQDTNKLVEDHVAALTSGDVELIVSHYATDAILIHLQGIASGYEEIRGLFEFYVTGVLIPGESNFNLQASSSTQNIGCIIWSADTPTFDIPFATDTFVFNDKGLIIQQTTAGIMNPKD